MTCGHLARIENIKPKDCKHPSSIGPSGVGVGAAGKDRLTLGISLKRPKIPGRYWVCFISIVWLLGRRMCRLKISIQNFN